MDKFAPTIPADEALAELDRALAGRRVPTETVPLGQAMGRVLAEDAVSVLDLPPFDKSAMDGYALLAGDRRQAYRILETVGAGEVPGCALAPGTAIKVMTGAPVPDGAGWVVPVEHTEVDGETLRVTREPSKSNICRHGEDVRAGDVLLRAGRTLRDVDVANLVGSGLTRVSVSRRVRLAVLSTGDEIVDCPSRLGPGKIMNVNGPMLCMLAERHGMEVVVTRSLPDEREATLASLRAAADKADLVVLSGGVSVGDFDYVLESFARADMTVRFARVGIQPGRPTTLAVGPGGVALGLPGNPVSSFVMFHLFVLRAAAALTGARYELREICLPLKGAFSRRKTERRLYVPGRLTADGRVEPLEYHGSAHLMAVSRSDGFFVVPAGTASLADAQTVTFVPVGGGLG